MIDGRPRPDHGPGQVEHVCRCGAGWVGAVDEGCWWCAQAEARQLADYRGRLLWPDWLTDQGPAYDALPAIDKRVWDQTRGIMRGADSERTWAQRLADAVAAGIVSEREARTVLDRAQARKVTS